MSFDNSIYKQIKTYRAGRCVNTPALADYQPLKRWTAHTSGFYRFHSFERKTS